MPTPYKGQAFNVTAVLYKTDGTIVANVGTITAKISKDYGAYNDVGTATDEDTTYGQVKLALTATEMTADVVDLYVVDDTSGAVPFTATIYTVKPEHAGIIALGAAQSASSTGVVLAAAEAFADDVLIGATILVHGSTQGYWQSRIITDNALSGDAVTVDTWTVTPSGTITYIILATPPGSVTAPVPSNLTHIAGAAVSTSTAQLGVNVVDSVSIAEIGAGAPAAAGTLLTTAALSRALARNKRDTDVTTGETTVYADDGSTPLFTYTISQTGDVVTRTELAAP